MFQVVQVLNLLLSEFWSLPSCALETVVVIESLFAMTRVSVGVPDVVDVSMLVVLALPDD